MVIMLGIALVSVIAMYLLYPYCNRYVRVENTGASKRERSIIIKRILSSSLSGTGNVEAAGKKIGFSIFIAIFVVAFVCTPDRSDRIQRIRSRCQLFSGMGRYDLLKTALVSFIL